MRGALDLDVAQQPDYTLVTVTGGLHLGSYRQLRDGLLEIAADEPEAVIAGIGGLDLGDVAPVGVFGLVARRLGTWPGIPLALAAGAGDQAQALREHGVHRQVAIGENVRSAERALLRPSRQRTEVVLPRSLDASAVARAAVREACTRWEVPQFVYDGILVAGELAANVVQHTTSAATLRLDLRRGRLTIAVLDDDPRPAVLLPRTRPTAAGLGLHIVARSADTWGSSPRWSGGKVVWAVVTSEQPN
ncbi:ATP-binding protein [Amycolatopsis sp. OK19-0408]|uniref:ATP-binding protein n=1 Tax=Amycolatopsis iheyensis TaxID=2945988 RepID=A0A9X2NDZ7_9PSEU|nr:ATP-binding protein [Amycolatopsis iheyensis]MCR6485120.1 ATP-binding protein [Amycolatopsis iheyensis]